LSRGDLTEVEWRILRVLLPVERKPGKRGRGRPPVDNRNIINGILWRLRTGAPWRDVSAHKHGICSMTTVVRCPRTGHACSEPTCQERHWRRKMFERGLSPRGLPLKRKFRPRCCAKTRAGAPCIMRVVPGKRRCRFYGGRSPRLKHRSVARREQPLSTVPHETVAPPTAAGQQRAIAIEKAAARRCRP
jgi:transposase